MILGTEDKNGWKPAAVCSPGQLPITTARDFFIEKKRQLDSAFAELGLVVRKVEPKDYSDLMRFIEDHFYGYANLTPARMYQIISFGESILLVDLKNEIRGYILEVSYLRDQISHGASMAVHPDLAGCSVGTHLFTYSAILAMNSGAVMKKGIISPNNYPSIKSIVNGSGACIIDYKEDLFGLGPKLMFNLPLVPQVLQRNAFDPTELNQLVGMGAARKLPADDLETVGEVLQEEVIIALHAGHFISCPSANFYHHYLT